MLDSPTLLSSSWHLISKWLNWNCTSTGHAAVLYYRSSLVSRLVLAEIGGLILVYQGMGITGLCPRQDPPMFASLLAHYKAKGVIFVFPHDSVFWLFCLCLLRLPTEGNLLQLARSAPDTLHISLLHSNSTSVLPCITLLLTEPVGRRKRFVVTSLSNGSQIVLNTWGPRYLKIPLSLYTESSPRFKGD